MVSIVTTVTIKRTSTLHGIKSDMVAKTKPHRVVKKSNKFGKGLSGFFIKC